MSHRAEARVAALEEAAETKADTHPPDWTLSPRPWRSAAAAAALGLVDWLTILASLAVSLWLTRWDTGVVAALSTSVVDLFGLVPWILAFAQARLYTRRALFWDEARRVLYACTVATLVALGIALAGTRVPLAAIAGTWFLAIIAVPLMRYYAKRLLTVAGVWNKRVLIVGAGETGRQVWQRIRESPDLGYEPMAYVDDDAQKVGRVLDDLPVCGPLSTLPDIIDELGVKDIVVAMPQLERERILHLVATCEGRIDSIRLVPDLFGLASVGVEVEDLDGVLLLHMRWNLAKPWNLLAKRVFDLAIASAAATLLLPFAAVIAVAIRLDSPGPVFFRQERMGRGRRLFRCMKFRTMYVDNDQRLHTHLQRHERDRHDWDRFRKLKTFDPRVTGVGRMLRRFSVDELPQLLNVFRNEMSLVGPRPYLPEEAERMGDFCETVLKASPGMTGLWQVSGRNNLTFDQRLRLDEYYVRNWSLWLDAVLLLKTITAVLHRRGAY